MITANGKNSIVRITVSRKITILANFSFCSIIFAEQKNSAEQRMPDVEIIIPFVSNLLESNQNISKVKPKENSAIAYNDFTSFLERKSLLITSRVLLYRSITLTVFCSIFYLQGWIKHLIKRKKFRASTRNTFIKYL